MSSDCRTIDANGIRFAYLAEGEGPLVVLLHGFPDTAHTWDDLRPRLAARGYRAVSPFMRGYHPTEVPPRDADAETLARDVLALIDAFGEREAILVRSGSSRVGFVARHFFVIGMLVTPSSEMSLSNWRNVSFPLRTREKA
jgi:pimeloyl-ACP methyl ester carboxylesterase